MNEQEIDWKKHGLMTDEELKEIDDNFKRIEKEGNLFILRYFDRIHDKLFTFNNILIVGYFALSKLSNSISMFNILIPFINLGILIFIEYRMMEKSIFESKITTKTKNDIDKYGGKINKTNLFSLLSIFTTLIVTLIFLNNLLFKSN